MDFHIIVLITLWSLSVSASLFSFVKRYFCRPQEPRYEVFLRYFIYYLLLFLFSFIFLPKQGDKTILIHTIALEACFCVFYAICNWYEFRHMFKYLFRCYFGFMCRKKSKSKKNSSEARERDSGVANKKVVWI